MKSDLDTWDLPEEHALIEQMRDTVLSRINDCSAKNMRFYWRTVYLVGNGAVTGGDIPLRHWLAEGGIGRRSPFYKDLDWGTKLGHMSMLSRLARTMTEGDKSTSSDSRSFCDNVAVSRDDLAKRYKNAVETKSITARRLPDVLERGLYSGDSLVICLNWDTTFFDDSRIPNIIQLHGSTSQPSTMIFPCEFALDFFGRNRKDGFPYDIPNETVKLIGYAHRISMESIERCTNVVVWGLNVNAYDAEVIAVLNASSGRNNIKKLDVVNPSKEAGKRAAAILGCESFNLHRPGKDGSWEVDHVRP